MGSRFTKTAHFKLNCFELAIWTENAGTENKFHTKNKRARPDTRETTAKWPFSV